MKDPQSLEDDDDEAEEANRLSSSALLILSSSASSLRHWASRSFWAFWKSLPKIAKPQLFLKRFRLGGRVFRCHPLSSTWVIFLRAPASGRRIKQARESKKQQNNSHHDIETGAKFFKKKSQAVIDVDNLSFCIKKTWMLDRAAPYTLSTVGGKLGI